MSEPVPEANQDRRRCVRVQLHWTVLLAAHGLRHPIRTETEDISSSGFSCVVDEPLTPGERLECDILLPTHALHDRDETAFLRCSVEVLRVERRGGGYGLSCRIAEYGIVRRRESDPAAAGEEDHSPLD